MLCLRLHFPSMLACHFELYAHFRFSQWRRFPSSLPSSDCCCYFSSLISSSWPSRKFFFFARIALLRLTANAPGNDIRHGLPRSAKQLSRAPFLCVCVCVCIGDLRFDKRKTFSITVASMAATWQQQPLDCSLSFSFISGYGFGSGNCSNPCRCHVRRQFWVAASLLAVPR